MFSQRPNVVNFLLLLLVVNFASASQHAGGNSPPKDEKAKILASSNVKLTPQLQNNLKALLAKSTAPVKQEGPDPSGELKSLSSGDGGDSEPSIQSKNLEGLTEFDSPIYNGFKKLFYSSFCRPLGLTVPTDITYLHQLDAADGAAPMTEMILGSGTCVRRESISSMFTDELCNNLLPNQVLYINNHKRLRPEDFEQKLEVKDDSSVNLKNKNKIKVQGNLAFHPGLGVYFDSVCNMYIHKDNHEEFFHEVADLLGQALSAKNKQKASKTTPAGTTLWKVPNTDVWVDQNTCDLISDKEAAFFKDANIDPSKGKKLRALLGI